MKKLSKEEAKEKIKNECKFETITFTYKDKEWNVESRDIDTKYDIDQTIENALNVKKNKNILYNSIDMIKSNLGIENNVNIVVDCNEEKVKEKLKEISKEMTVIAQNWRDGSRTLIKIGRVLPIKNNEFDPWFAKNKKWLDDSLADASKIYFNIAESESKVFKKLNKLIKSLK